MAIQRAQRQASKIKFSIQGPAGGGKTFSALRIATALIARTDPGKEIGLIDTENSAQYYAPPFQFDCEGDFGEGASLAYDPKKLLEYLEVFRKSVSPTTGKAYGAVIVDSLTPFWDSVGGFNAMHAKIGAQQKATGKQEDTWGNWKYIDPQYNAMWTYFRNYPLHLILCLRSEEKTERVNGKIVKQGLSAIMRKKWEFEVDIQFAVEDQGKVMVPMKHRLGAAMVDQVFELPGDNVAAVIAGWLSKGPTAQASSSVAAEIPNLGLVPLPGVNDLSPPATTPEPPMAESTASPEPVTEQASVSLKDSILSQIAAATTKEELSGVSKRANGAKNEGLVVGDDWKAVLAAFSAKQKVVAGVAA